MTYGADRTVQDTKNKSRVITSTYFLLVSEVNGYAVGCPLCTWNEQVKTVRLRSSVISHMDDNSSQLQLAFSDAQQNRIRHLLYTHHRNAAICALV